MISSPADRLIIRPFQEADAGEFFELAGDEGFNAFPINIYRQKDLNSALEWIHNAHGKYGVWEKSSGELIGMGGLTHWVLDEEEMVDITYRLRSSAHGRGLGMELATALRDHAFQTMKLPEITATITPDNVPSKKIAEKLGFKFSKHILLKNVPTDLYRLARETSR
ncbi:MAG: GNAT family N-acetyltransferase [Bdellovibrionota bacterium]